MKAEVFNVFVTELELNTLRFSPSSIILRRPLNIASQCCVLLMENRVQMELIFWNPTVAIVVKNERIAPFLHFCFFPTFKSSKFIN